MLARTVKLIGETFRGGVRRASVPAYASAAFTASRASISLLDLASQPAARQPA